MSLTGDTAADTIEELARGCSGDKVVRLQERLNELGFSVGTVDGSYGKKTEFAVRDFQERNGLSVTGIADVDTQELLYSDNALATHFALLSMNLLAVSLRLLKRIFELPRKTVATMYMVMDQ